MPRIKILKRVVLVALAVITVRLFFIQIIEHDQWVAKANDQHTMVETIVAKRGEIYMMDGDTPVPVVLNQTTYSVIIDPAIAKKDDVQNVLNTNAKDYLSANLDEVYAHPNLRYFVVAKNVPRSNATKIAEAKISGIWFQSNNQRVYPEGDMASGLLGFVNADGIGQYGVEGSLGKILAGKDGLIKSISDINNVALSIGNDNVKIPAENGKDIVLSVDRGLEKGVEEVMAGYLEESPATNAAAIVMEPTTGKILAMANLPNYNPADYGNVKDASAYTNYTTEIPYEPASICKSFTFSAAINEGVMTPETTYFNQGYETIDGWPIKNAAQDAKLYGTIDMRTALSWSLNTGSIYALKLLGGNTEEINRAGREKLYDYYYNKFRLSRPTGIELIEGEGFLQDPNEGYGRNSAYANMTFGQNLGITMIQTATAFSAVINGGYYRTPSVVAGTLEGNGTILPLENPDYVEAQILKTETSDTMRDLLINNRKSKVRYGIDKEGYAVGGKSGTAQVIVDGKYDASMDELVGSYIGFGGPSGELPKYVIMVKIWGEGQALNGELASLLFDSLSNYTIDYLKIKPKE